MSPLRKLLSVSALLAAPLVLVAQAPVGDYKSPAAEQAVPTVDLEVDSTADALQATLYELTDQYYTVHQAHWNIQGPLYYELHIMLQEFYEALARQIDVLAERKLSLNRPADSKPGNVAERADLDPELPEGYLRDKAALEVIVQKYKVMSDRLAQRLMVTDRTDPTTNNILQETKALIEHQMWQTRAHLQ